MEPLIIDYYNEYPQFIKIIDNLNDELSIIQNKYETLKLENNYVKNYHKYLIPYRVCDNIYEYKAQRLSIELNMKYAIMNLLEDDDNGIEAICNLDTISNDITINKLKRGLFITQYREYSIIDKIITIFSKVNLGSL